MRLRLAILASAAVAASACTENTATPTAVRAPVSASLTRSAAVSVSATAGGSYIVSFNGTTALAKLTTLADRLGGRVSYYHTGAGLAFLTGIPDSSASQLASISGVSAVQADAQFALDEPLASARVDVSSVDPSVTSATNPTRASRYAFQWNMRLIQADKAWAAGKLGSSGVTVAIIDTGIDYDDFDVRGLVDLSRSVSFVPSDDSITTQYFPTRNPITDYHGHGTNVAQQVSSNAAALAGVTSRTTLIGVKVLGANGSGRLGAVLSGVLWAADHGADVANMSLGGGFAKAGNGQFVSLINRVFNYARQKGMLVAVAAGNAAEDLDHNGNEESTYCDSPNVVCVSSVGPALATSNPDTPAYYTNFGRSSIDVAGPGGNADAANGFTVSTWPWGNDIASWVWSFCSKTTLAGFTKAGVPILAGCQSGGFLTGFIGTSQATPHVAGLAALLVAETGHGQPGQIKNMIEQSADDLGQPGTDPFYGKGRINVARAVGLQ